ncbi:hypothetical protein K525DRAFT_220548 [Schizophyllum commune Loenen D]|nr:hypothetical protein K525DRAFT_220548 [Schizophyllum commune Loenen D]
MSSSVRPASKSRTTRATAGSTARATNGPTTRAASRTRAGSATPGMRTGITTRAAAKAAASPATSVTSLPQSPKRPLKRAASTMSLPTPPRTQKRKRNRRSATPQSDSDTEDERGPKKRKTSEERIMDEDAFWMSRGLAPVAEADEEGDNADGGAGPSTVDEEQPVLFRKLQRQGTTGMPPMSPPPSHRKVVKVRATATKITETVVVPRPTTPTPKTPTRRVVTPRTPKPRSVARDSPENPFLESPTTPTRASGRSSTAESPVAGPAKLRDSPDLDERPMLTYVYRGTKRQLPNPNWDHAKNRPKSPDPRSLLDPSDPDYVPDLRCAPKILFPQARKGKGKARATVRKSQRHASPALASDSDGDDYDERDTLPSVKLDFGAVARAAPDSP